MYQLLMQIPDVNLLLNLAPEELAAKMLLLMRQRATENPNNNRMFLLRNLEIELWDKAYKPAYPGFSQYPREKEGDVSLALSEAWAWLEAQGLLVPASDSNGQNGWRVLSRRAKAIESEAEFADFKIARLLPKEILHPKIADRVWGAFMRGEYDSAVSQAMKAVEVSVREASGIEEIGVKLMRKAFAPEDGPLTDMTTESGERQGRVEFFSGAIASYKNPQSHRDVNLDDPKEALEIIYLANHLLGIVDARAKARLEANHE